MITLHSPGKKEASAATINSLTSPAVRRNSKSRKQMKSALSLLLNENDSNLPNKPTTPTTTTTTPANTTVATISPNKNNSNSSPNKALSYGANKKVASIDEDYGDFYGSYQSLEGSLSESFFLAFEPSNESKTAGSHSDPTTTNLKSHNNNSNNNHPDDENNNNTMIAFTLDSIDHVEEEKLKGREKRNKKEEEGREEIQMRRRSFPSPLSSPDTPTAPVPSLLPAPLINVYELITLILEDLRNQQQEEPISSSSPTTSTTFFHLLRIN